jgi:hypothetical protein
MLARHEPRKPRQASLRRAVSTAYYALFHLLTSEAADRMTRGGQDRVALRATLRRAFTHSDMKQACDEMTKLNGGRFVTSLNGNVVPQSLSDVADAFSQLQQARHEADYDLSRAFTRRETNDLIDLADKAFADWQTIRGSVGADVLLAGLLAKRGMFR